MTEERNTVKIKELREAGKTGDQITEITGIPRATVYRLIKELGLSKRVDRKHYDDYIEDVKKLYSEGFTQAYIAKNLGIKDTKTIAKWLKQADIEIVDKHWKNDKRLRAIELRKETRVTSWGATVPKYGVNQISDMLDVTVESVSKWLKEAGFSITARTKDSLPPQDPKRPQYIDYIEDIKRLYLEGKRIYEIADELNLYEGTVSDWLKRTGISTKKGAHNFTPAQIKEYSLKGVEARNNSASNGNVENYYVERSTINGVECEGTYEYKFAKRCVELEIPIRRYDRKSVENGGDGLIRYINSAGKESEYGPDFIIEHQGREIAVEVKGRFDLDVFIKANAYQRTGKPYLMVDKKFLSRFERDGYKELDNSLKVFESL